MSAVNEWLVREFFESLGYLVMQPRKYVTQGQQKSYREEIDLLVMNPTIEGISIPDKTVWDTGDLKGISRAIIGIRGWHTEKFYVSILEQTPRIFNFTGDHSLRYAAKLLNTETGKIAKILCIPKLPDSGSPKEKAVKVLRQNGIDGVISFETILSSLLSFVDSKKNYEKSDVLQVLRLLKNYGMTKDGQMELFPRKRNS